MARIIELAESRLSILGASESANGCERIRFSFSANGKAEIQSDVEGALRDMDAMRGVQESLAELFPEHGLVRPEQYDEDKDALRQSKEQVIAEFARTKEERAAWRESWPFDD